MRLFKVLGKDRMPCHGGSGQWPEAGTWLEIQGELKPCENGLHLCREGDLVIWLGEEIWEAEYEGEVVEKEDKIVVSKARLVRRLETWNDRSALLFAADCAEDCLHNFESKFPGDDRPRKAIEAARSAASSAASSAAWSAAGSAAESAAWSAAGSEAWSAASSAASSAAESAARSAAGSAAESEAWGAARSKQTQRLMKVLYPEQ